MAFRISARGLARARLLEYLYSWIKSSIKPARSLTTKVGGSFLQYGQRPVGFWFLQFGQKF